MNIDFWLPFKGIYNNAGSSRQLANYLEHEDLERMEQGIHTEGFFNRSENKLNIHCHLIVSRKDQSNKVKISPLTNHRNTKKGVTTGGFDHTTLFENVEKGFDKLFGYNRHLSETFEYWNTMKNTWSRINYECRNRN